MHWDYIYIYIYTTHTIQQIHTHMHTHVHTQLHTVTYGHILTSHTRHQRLSLGQGMIIMTTQMTTYV